MKKRTLIAICLLVLARSASAFDPFTIMACKWLVEYVGVPVGYALSCAFAYSPPLRVFGTEECVCGLDWGSLACHARDVYGLQACFCGGVVERRLCGFQLGLIATGYAAEEIPYGDRHYCSLDYCSMNGLQVGTFAAKTATANGIQLSAVYTESDTVNGIQVGLVNRTRILRGFQAGVYNSAESGCGIQIGVLNRAEESDVEFLPVLNLVL